MSRPRGLTRHLSVGDCQVFDGCSCHDPCFGVLRGLITLAARKGVEIPGCTLGFIDARHDLFIDSWMAAP